MQKLASDKQLNLIALLAEKRDYSADKILVSFMNHVNNGGNVEMSLASSMIGRFFNCSVIDDVVVNAGRYAVEFDGKLRFFVVNTPTEGRWKGFVFVSEQVSDDEYSVRDFKRRNAILNAIANDPDSLARYGKMLGVCGICGRTLTDETSRQIGLGPVCRTR